MSTGTAGGGRYAPPPRTWALDERTVSALRASTPPLYLARNDALEREGVSPYTPPPPHDPRARIAFCARCNGAFWTRTAAYCGYHCRTAANQTKHRRLRGVPERRAA